MFDAISSDIPVYMRDTSRLTPGVMASISYHPSRGKHGEKGRTGVISSVQTLDDAQTQFVFYDESRDRDIEVTIGETIGQSNVRSRKDERWISLGKLLRIQVGDLDDGYDDLMSKGIEEAYEGRYESIVAVAAVKWNQRILEWFEWSNRHA